MIDQQTASKTTTTLAGLPNLTGTTLGLSSNLEIDQHRIDTFAAATEDQQWIHVDPIRARTGPFGTTIAHGYLSLSLLAGLSFEILEITDASAILNYGLDKVRFPTPVPVGSQVRLQLDLVSTRPVSGGLQLELLATILVQGSVKPAVVATQILRVYH